MQEDAEKNVMQAYREAAERLDAAFFDGYGHYYCHDMKDRKVKRIPDKTDEKRLADALDFEDISVTKKAVQLFLDETGNGSVSSVEYKKYVSFIFWYIYKSDPVLLRKVDFEMINKSVTCRLTGCATKSDTDSEIFVILEELFQKVRENGMPGDDMMKAVQKYLSEHYMENLSRTEVAELFHFSPSYFSVIFKKTFGVSFTEYLTEVRMKAAGQLLEKRYNLTEIAQKTGYSDVKYFLRVFKQYFKCTPNDYRRKREIKE